MKCRHKPGSLQTHHELLPTNSGVMRCLAQPLRGSTTTKRASDPTTRPNRLHTHTYSPKRLAHPRSPMLPLSTLTARATHALPLHPAALASVPYGIVLVSVRVPRTQERARRTAGQGSTKRIYMEQTRERARQKKKREEQHPEVREGGGSREQQRGKQSREREERGGAGQPAGRKRERRGAYPKAREAGDEICQWQMTSTRKILKLTLMKNSIDTENIISKRQMQ